MKSILIYGGTFDPPHLGHINTLLKVQEKFNFDQIKLIPCKIPVLKDKPSTSIEDRLAMLQLLLPYCPQFNIDTCEIERQTPSYTFETLQSYRALLENNTSLTLLMGYDAFVTLDKWHQYERLLDLCNFLIMNRNIAKPLNKKLQKLLGQHISEDYQILQRKSYGNIICYDAGNYPIASSTIRRNIAEGISVDKMLLPEVYQYIREHKLYNPSRER